jgi:hypothetical protein
LPVPLLSATERIIREAEAAEARKSAAGDQSAQGGVASAWSQPIPEPAGVLPELTTQPTFVDGYPDYDDLSDGITRVDLNRSALALEKLRAFDAQAPAGGVREAGPGTGGPALPGAPSRTLPVGEAPASESPARLRRGPPPGRPGLLSDASLLEARAPRTPSAPLPAVTAPASESAGAATRSRSISLRHAPRVGRRLGLVIAAVTAAAVAPLVGSWTAHFENAASARGGVEALSIGAPVPSSTSAGAAAPTIAPMVVPTAAADPGPLGAAPAQQPTLPLEPSGKASGSSPDSPERGSSSAAGAEDRALAAVEPRPVQKSNAGKKTRRRAHQTKVSTAAAPRVGAPRPAGPAPGAVRHDARLAGDPDDTLPIAVE